MEVNASGRQSHAELSFLQLALQSSSAGCS